MATFTGTAPYYCPLRISRVVISNSGPCNAGAFAAGSVHRLGWVLLPGRLLCQHQHKRYVPAHPIRQSTLESASLANVRIHTCVLSRLLGSPLPVCPAGSYCTGGTAAPTGTRRCAFPDTVVRVQSRRAHPSETDPGAGSNNPTVCPSPAACSTAGYYCPSGSTSATQYSTVDLLSFHSWLFRTLSRMRNRFLSGPGTTSLHCRQLLPRRCHGPHALRDRWLLLPGWHQQPNAKPYVGQQMPRGGEETLMDAS